MADCNATTETTTPVQAAKAKGPAAPTTLIQKVAAMRAAWTALSYVTSAAKGEGLIVELADDAHAFAVGQVRVHAPADWCELAIKAEALHHPSGYSDCEQETNLEYLAEDAAALASKELLQPYVNYDRIARNHPHVDVEEIKASDAEFHRKDWPLVAALAARLCPVSTALAATVLKEAQRGLPYEFILNALEESGPRPKNPGPGCMVANLYRQAEKLMPRLRADDEIADRKLLMLEERAQLTMPESLEGAAFHIAILLGDVDRWAESVGPDGEQLSERQATVLKRSLGFALLALINHGGVPARQLNAYYAGDMYGPGSPWIGSERRAADAMMAAE